MLKRNIGNAHVFVFPVLRIPRCNIREQCYNANQLFGLICTPSILSFPAAACTRTATVRMTCRIRWRIINRERPQRGPARPPRPARLRRGQANHPPRPSAALSNIRPVIRSIISRNRRSRRSTRASPRRYMTTKTAATTTSTSSTATSASATIRRPPINCLAIKASVRRPPSRRNLHRHRRSIRSDSAQR